ncbi:MAG: ATP-binding protein [Candidatus Omnitrophota bacterium]|nr:ATP-binding protein [Candidatus Omnitrophota bacterium]
MDKKERLQYQLKETNPWWKKEGWLLEPYVGRRVFSEIEKYLKYRQIIALVGLRRTGKTTLLLKLIEQTLRNKPSREVLYFSFDDYSSLEIEELLEAYQALFPERRVDGAMLYCFDEIQKLENWQEKIKRLYDTHPSAKILLSGSESLFIRKGIKETLAGRIYEFRVAQLTFKEYLEFNGKAGYAAHQLLHKEELIRAYRHYLKTNGFPELAAVKDDTVIHKYLKETVVDKILFKDIPALFGAPRSAPVVGELLDIVMCSPGQVIDVSKLARDMGITRQRAATYLDYLEKSFLVRKIYNFSRSLRKQKRALKKYYPAVVLPVVVEEKFAACFENSLVWQLDAEFFYRDAYQNEVDIVLAGPKQKPLPIEIKTGEVSLRGIRAFMRKFKVRRAKVITLDRAKKEGNIELVPFYQYIL